MAKKELAQIVGKNIGLHSHGHASGGSGAYPIYWNTLKNAADCGKE